MSLTIPARLAATCSKSPEWMAWLDRLPKVVAELERRWSLEIGPPYVEDVSGSWVAPVRRADGSDAVIKVFIPDMEAEQEIDGLRYWNGDPTVLLFEADDEHPAMLIEKCGSTLRSLPEAEQDVVIAGLLRRLWRAPPQAPRFRPLSEMLAFWTEEALEKKSCWPDAGLVRKGLRLWEELPRTAETNYLLATDLHAGNVLKAKRQPWLVVDPKPFVGDPAYDATQHLFNCLERLQADPIGLIKRFSDLLEVDAERVRLWTFSRAAAEFSFRHFDLARRLSY